MSKSLDNIVTKGLSGTMYDVVFRQWFGKTIAAKRPRKSSKATTANQLEHREQFNDATVYAKAAIKNEELKLAYQSKTKPGQTAYNMAIVDFFNAPRIRDINTADYNGQIGSIINIAATDDFKVVSVKVKIEKSGGGLIEEGDAILSNDELHWLYTATKTGNGIGSVISVIATDLPGNSIVKQKTI